MLRYKSFFKAEALGILVSTAILLLVYAYGTYIRLSDMTEHPTAHYSNDSYITLGMLIPFCSLSERILRDKFLQMLPVSTATKFAYVMARTIVLISLFLLLSAGVEWLMNWTFSGSEIHVAVPVGEMLMSPVIWSQTALFGALCFTSALLFRKKLLHYVLLIVLVIVVYILSYGLIRHGQTIGVRVLEVFSVLLALAITLINYQIYKRWQPANNGILML